MTNIFSSFKNTLLHNLLNVPGWRTPRKIVVIESDDWGSIRMPSPDVLHSFQEYGHDFSGSIYNQLDTLERNEDLQKLFEVLTSVRDGAGNHPIITANVVVGNPDFRRIRESGFKSYYYEPVAETFKRYPGSSEVISLWKQGIKERIFYPQFHGREHVNVTRWMGALQGGDPGMMFSFDKETTFSGDGDYNYMEVLDYNTPSDLLQMKDSLSEGLELFENIFGFRSKSFIPPCYTWSNEIEETLYQCGVRYIQGLVVQSVPTGQFGRYKYRYHFLGNKNSFGQHYLIRNSFFEPSLSAGKDIVGDCLKRINTAFYWKKPAVICTHRINFMGALNGENRTNNLILFKELLYQITNRWPDVEFMTSDQLGDIISHSFSD
jgi:hypothetical protein